MNRLVSQHSIYYIAFAWILAFTLFADGANLDDLCAGTLVLHDDDEVTLPMDVNLAGWTDPGTNRHAAEHRPSHEPKRDAKSSPAAPIRVIVDQDSPSLQADPSCGTMFDHIITADRVPLALQKRPVHDALHLKLCTLLI